MRTRFAWLGVVAMLIISICAIFVSCNKELNDIVKYYGEVVYINTTNPFPNLTVKVTNGADTHCQALTDEAGQFMLKVRVNEIDGSYYLLAGDSTCIPKKVALGGYGQEEVDLGVIEVEGPALPTVESDTIVRDVTAESAVIGGKVLTDGRLTVTARGICYGKTGFPTVEGLHTTEGTGLGAFTSHLKDLEHDAIYYARAYATNRLGTAYGEQVKFTTKEGVPVVRTDTIVNITAHSARCSGYVISDGGYNVISRGTCWSTHHDPTIYDNFTNDGSGLKEFVSLLSDLQENTTYYIRAYATNSTSTEYGEEKSFTTLDGLARVKTDSLTNITATSCMAFGAVLADCDIPVTERGFCYSTTQYPTIDNKHVAVNKGLGTFHATLSDLEYATTYYVRAYATNATATVYDSLQLEVTTLSGLPTVVTDSAVTNICSVKASCHGEVTDDGTLTVTARGICYGTEPQLTINDTHTEEGRGKGKFTSNLKNLKDSTVYYYRAYATTDAGTAYGKEYSFMTKNGIPVVILEKLVTPTANSITCKGNVTGDGGVTVTERGFCYSLTQYPTIDDKHVAIGNGMGEFSGSLTGLAINTKYYVRAYAVNSLGVGYSAQQSFTTQNGLPTVTTAVPTSTATTINAGGEVTANGGYPVTERGICYSTTNSEPTIADQKVISGKGNGVFNLSIPDLTAATTYYLRAYATNENGTAYGEAKTIDTKNGVAVVKVGKVTNVTAISATDSVTVTDAGGSTLKSCGICWSTTPNPTIENNNVAGGNQLNTAYSCNMTELSPSTKYYVRAYAITEIATSYSEQVTFNTVSGLPVVTTGTPTTTATSITAKGEVTDNGGYNVTERGFCYSLTNSEPTLNDTKVVSGSGNGSFNASITDLTAATTYYVRAYATNSIGTSYGKAVSVTTKDGKSSVTASEATNITALSATVSVTVSDAGGAILQSCGICWATTENPTVDNNKAVAEGKKLKTAYSCNMTELAPNTTYYVRAYAVTDLATAYSEQITFSTVSGLPIVSTGEATPTATSMIATGEVTNNGGYNVTERGICYSATNSEPTLTDKKIASGSGNGKFNASITELTAATTYYVRAYATNSIGTSYGKVVSVTTKDGKSSVTASEATNITALSATVSVTVTEAGGATLLSCGICWATTANPTIDNNKAVAEGKQLKTAYSCNMTELAPNTTYYVRAYAITDIATAYSEQITFSTVSGLPVVTTGTPTTTATSITATGEVTDNGGYNVTERGFCYSATNSEPTLTDKKIASGSGNGSFNASITELTASTTYYVRAYATNSIGTSYGKVVSVTTKDGKSAVTAGEVINITALSATGSVTVTDAGGTILQSCGICWATTENPTIDNNKAVAEGKQLNTAYPCNMTGLAPNTTYYVRAYAITDLATAYSEQRIFSTVSGLPVVTTGAATPAATSMVATGEVTDNGGYNVTERGFCYSATNSEPTLTDKKNASGSGNGAFNASITELTAATTYYVRAYAINSIGTSYGNVTSVTTKNGVAAVTTGVVNNITALSATSSVTVTDAAGATLQTCGICWGTIPNPTTSDNSVTGGNQVSTVYNCNMTGLTPNTMYYVRAYAITNITTSYGNEVTFTTTSGLPSVSTAPTTATSTTITSGGTISSDGGYGIIARGVCYSTSNSLPTLDDSYTTAGSGTGMFSTTITNVSVSTTYYVRAYATNSIGTEYGDVQTVMTGNGMPSVTTTVVGENVTETTAVSGGNVTDDGGYTVTARGVCWSTIPNPTINDNKTVDGSGVGYFSSSITGIDLSGTNIYYIRAYATNSNGTSYGASVTISKENFEYAQLPIVQYGGYTYRLYNDIGEMTWGAANAACQNMTFGGYSDWYLPTREEVPNLITLNKSGWLFDGSTNVYGEYITKYWTSTPRDEDMEQYFYVLITVDKYTSAIGVRNTYYDWADGVMYRVRPVRKYIANQ